MVTTVQQAIHEFWPKSPDVRLKLRTTFSHLKSHPHNTLQTHTARTERHTEGGGVLMGIRDGYVVNKVDIDADSGQTKITNNILC